MKFGQNTRNSLWKPQVLQLWGKIPIFSTRSSKSFRWLRMSLKNRPRNIRCKRHLKSLQMWSSLVSATIPILMSPEVQVCQPSWFQSWEISLRVMSKCLRFFLISSKTFLSSARTASINKLASSQSSWKASSLFFQILLRIRMKVLGCQLWKHWEHFRV